ncbi:isoflavone reductase [Apiospora rasikravindrae]|uniref:Isoflavone reductase n=1 Tax=Apiospora rasikravindrae TaxID=990691 RepID=A0ABR1UAB8_9PEZI
MSAIKNVTVVGASGTLGVPLVKALQESGFHVTALSRAGSPSSPPPGVEVKKALKAALTGQDALVSVITTTATGEQYPFIDAAIAAGVKRIVPSEFGINTRTVPHPGLRAMLQSKIKLVDYLQEKSGENPDLTWTGICNSFFFDSIKRGSGFGFDLKTKKATIIDSGDEPFDVATLSFVAKAVAAVLSAPEKTANQYLTVSGTVTTQNELLAILREETGGDWKTEKVAADKYEETGNDKMARGTTRPSGTSCTSCSSATGRARPSRPPANELLGLEREDTRTALKALLAGASF